MQNFCKFLTVLVTLSICSFIASAEPDYGAESANTSFYGTVSAGGGDYNYLNLRDHIGPSGVPFGGIGTGCFDLAPDGRFTRIALNNTHEDGVVKDVKAAFFAVWENNTRENRVTVRRLVRDSGEYADIRGFDHSMYRGLFPTARVAFEDDFGRQKSRLSLYGCSGCVPQNTKDSALPVAWFEVTAVNTERKPLEISVALSWEDIISRGLFDIKDMQEIEALKNNTWGVKRANWEKYKRVGTFAEPLEVGTWQGIRQFTDKPFRPLKYTYQNYVTEVAILAQRSDGVEIFTLPVYDVDDPASSWKTFRETGTFPQAQGKTELYIPGKTGEKASAVALKIKLGEAETKTVRFMVAWYYPQMQPDRENAHPNSFWGTQDYARYFHNYFDSLEDIVKYAAANRERIHEQTTEWHRPVLESTYPDWLKFKLINCGYVLYTNSILNKAGDFSVMEGKMGGLAGTMDQRLSAHPFYQKFFTDIDRAEMDLFAYTQDPDDGFILHFNGHYYLGIATRDGQTPAPRGTMLDNTGSWIIQLAKDYQQTGDIEIVREHIDRVRFAFENLKNNIISDIDIPVGKTTYDDYEHPPIYSYIAGVYLATLKAGLVLGEAAGDYKLVDHCKRQFTETQNDFVKHLWNGRFFSYGCELDGTAEQDYRMFTGQLGGQFVSRYCKWGDVVAQPMARASVLAQMKTSVSSAPSYYAPKVYDLNIHRGIDKDGSKCWPFYLESYTAMLAIQNGYVADGLEIMKNIQLVHLRKGWTWTQNLWNPGEATYMSAPVTWFITDVLAGAGLDVPNETLYLAPIFDENARLVRLPLFYPNFWATLEIEPEERKMRLKVEKVFENKSIVLNRIISVPAGRPANDARTIRINTFEVLEGAKLDLSEHWDQLTRTIIHRPVLGRAEQEPFITVTK